MAQRGIRECNAKHLLKKHWKTYFNAFKTQIDSISLHNSNDLERKAKECPWIKEKGLVIKPDMLFGKRGKNKLVLLTNENSLDLNLSIAKTWLNQKTEKETVLICGTKGKLATFILEPFFTHKKEEQLYLSALVDQDCDKLFFSTKGGIDVEENWDSVKSITIKPRLNETEIISLIDEALPKTIENRENLINFIRCFYNFFKALHFSYLELNPFIIRNNEVALLDVVAKIDDTATFLMKENWGDLDFPSSFGMPEATQEEKFIRSLDENTGASLKLTILNPKGLLWTLVAGGGASVVYADCIEKLWGASEIANYGEYSGNPSKEETYLYAKTIIELMTREKDHQGREKILIVGGSIANFTDVAKTFDGIIQVFKECYEKMKEIGIKIYVRRGGPNYELGLKNIEIQAKNLGLPILVYGPETHVTDIIRIAKERL